MRKYIFKHFLILFCIAALPLEALAGSNATIPLISNTDQGANRLIYYWDTRDRDTIFQLANNSDNTLVVHIQIFNVGSGSIVCEEVNWDDVYSAHDTHVYNIEDLESNCTADGILNSDCDAAPNPDNSNSYGFISISYVSGDQFSMIGMFRILDGPGGYEYRTNASAEDDSGQNTTDYILSFNNVDGNNLSDVVGIVYEEVEFDTVNAGLLSANFGTNEGDPFTSTFGVPQVFIFDEFEDGTSCSPTFFDCTVGDFNRGIDNSIPNSRQAGLGNRICNDSTLSVTNDAGWLYMPFDSFSNGTGGDVYFVGFHGINNGNGTGSMDSWVAVPTMAR